MYTAMYRANALLTFAGTVLAVMCVLATITDYFHVAHSVVSCQYLGVDGLQREYGHDRAYIVLDLDLDLRSEFTWNIKQIFAFANVEFETRQNKRNEMLLWSELLLSKDEARLRIPRLAQQYPYAVTDQGSALRGAEFNVSITWNVMPYVGRLYTRAQQFGPWRLPVDYETLQKQ